MRPDQGEANRKGAAYMLVIEIPELTLSTNEIMREFAHPQKKKRERERWHWVVRQAMKWHQLPKEPIDLCNITIYRCNNRLLDWDNMGGGLKFLLDALKSNNIIKDDNPKVVRSLQMHQPKVPGKAKRVIVEINPLTETDLDSIAIGQ